MAAGGVLLPFVRPGVSSFLIDVARRVGASLDLAQTLEQITSAVVDLLGFEVAVLNLVGPEGDLEVVAVAGPAQSLLGAKDSRANWETILGLAEQRGGLRFVDHATTGWPDGPSWVPDRPANGQTNAWHPEDALFAPLHGTSGELLGMLSVDCPVTGLRPDDDQCELLELFAVQAALALDHARMHARIERNERMMRTTFEHAPVGMAVFGPDRRLQKANPAYCAFLGRRLEDLIGMQVKDFTHPDDAAETEGLSREIRGDPLRVDRRYLHADGRTVWGRLSLTPITTGHGEVHVLAQLEDVTASRLASQELEKRARTDSLTGLDNHASARAQLRASLERPGGTAVLYCDVDNFKQVNDTLGHPAGDDLLVEIARNLQAVLRPGDHAGRLGGDEFVLVLHGVTAPEALEIAERARKAARRAVRIGERTVMTSMTIGVAVADSGADESLVLAAADRALLTAKRQGRDRVVLA